jgi:hypothetical protein
MTLLLEQYRRLGRDHPKTWVDAGYCIDAPEVFAGGSHYRDEFADGEWLAMPTMVDRLTANAK